jgi:hypothetical protein
VTSKAYRENFKRIRWAELPPSNPVEKINTASSGPTVIPDIAEFVAPGGVLIGSRSKLREYEQRTGTRQVGTDLKAEDYDVSKREPKIDERKIERAAYEALQRVLG